MKTGIAVFLLVWPQLLQAAEIRPALSETADRYLQGRISEREVIRQASDARKEKSFNEAERLYLEDLSRKLPLGIRHELCPSFEEGLCENAPGFQVWKEVPLLPAAKSESPPAEDSFWSRNKKWIALALVGGFGAAAWSLKDKEIQVQGFR